MEPDRAFLLADATSTQLGVYNIRNGNGEPVATAVAVAKVRRCRHLGPSRWMAMASTLPSRSEGSRHKPSWLNLADAAKNRPNIPRAVRASSDRPIETSTRTYRGDGIFPTLHIAFGPHQFSGGRLPGSRIDPIDPGEGPVGKAPKFNFQNVAQFSIPDPRTALSLHNVLVV